VCHIKSIKLFLTVLESLISPSSRCQETQYLEGGQVLIPGLCPLVSSFTWWKNKGFLQASFVSVLVSCVRLCPYDLLTASLPNIITFRVRFQYVQLGRIQPSVHSIGFIGRVDLEACLAIYLQWASSISEFAFGPHCTPVTILIEYCELS
jgi:hypothetical protein